MRIAAGAVVCARAIFEGGDISIGPDTVVFSGARIFCSKGAGPVVIGRGCVLEEGSSIECVEPGGLCVGEGNLFEVGCTVRSPVVRLPSSFIFSFACRIIVPVPDCFFSVITNVTHCSSLLFAFVYVNNYKS